MPAEQAAEALMASMKLNGIDRLWFTSGTELAFFQEVPVKHKALGRPTPTIMTMTHENAALSAAMGETMITGKPGRHSNECVRSVGHQSWGRRLCAPSIRLQRPLACRDADSHQ